MTLQILVLRKYLKCLYSGAVKTWKFALMGDSENSNDDDIMTMRIVMKVGVFLENNVLPHSKLTKQSHQGSLSGIETVCREL